MFFDKRLLIGIAIVHLVGCNSSPTMNAIPRSGIRSDAVGCWAFTDALESTRSTHLTQLPILARLDTTSTLAEVPGRRAVRRLGGNGQVMLHDAEGLALLDVWTADLHSDKIRILFSNGFYGSTWVLELPSQSGRVDTMRGRSNESSHDVHSADYAVREVLATRIDCAAVADSASFGLH